MKSFVEKEKEWIGCLDSPYAGVEDVYQFKVKTHSRIRVIYVRI